MKIESKNYEWCYHLTPNHQRRTYTIRFKDVKTGKTTRKMRTLPLSKDDFDEMYFFTFEDLRNFINNSGNVYEVK